MESAVFCNRLLLLAFGCMLNQHVHASICGKFSIGGPCMLLPDYTTTTTTLSPSSSDNSYCQLACGQDNDDNFSSLCACATTTTTEIPTTTPFADVCYYTNNRTAKLSTIVKRMYSGTEVATECEYPGVVGLYKDPDGPKEALQCMGTLLEEDKILIEDFCMDLINADLSQLVYVHAQSYHQEDVSTSSPYVNASTATLLDPTGANTKLYTISLSSPLTFNDQCVQPSCFPNARVLASDIDLTDCRIVGYGETTDGFGSPSKTLKEVKVSVNRNTVTYLTLKYTRLDGKSSKTGPCFNDGGAPVICNHKISGEWITVGVVLAVGVPCSTGAFVSPTVANLLKEARVQTLFNGLQTFKYISP
ncbi:unnamed protein product [Lymnaea stagnalis]|uniref:Peptidase S1 domain-containing protein n=1 Tax=Lymnaea stagnalis TaxID=6523 RepID=A0AAV2I3H0_LYMST